MHFGVIVNELGPHQPGHLLRDAFLDPSSYFDVIDATPVISVDGQFPDKGDVEQVAHIPRSTFQVFLAQFIAKLCLFQGYRGQKRKADKISLKVKKENTMKSKIC